MQVLRKLIEHDEQKLSTTGGTLTGNISFEGTTDDAYETTLTVTDPTADRTITLPNETGTVIVDTLPDGKILIACYHPSPRNVNTKVVTSSMINQLFRKAKKIAKF